MIKNIRKFVLHTLLILLFISAVLCLTYCGRDDTDDEGESVTFTSEALSASSGTEPSTTEKIPEASKEASSGAELSAEKLAETSGTEPLQTTSPPEENPPESKPLNVILNEFVQSMLENAIEYTGDDGKTHIVEPPPSGRSDDLQKKIVPLQSTPAPIEYLDDAIFIGDSVTTGFESFRKNIEICGEKIDLNYKVFAAKSYGAYNSTLEISDTPIHPLYKGEQFYPEDVIGVYESKKVFLCIGLNDVGWEKDDQFIRYYRSLLTRIKEKNPGVKIIIASITPLTKHGETTTNNELKNPRIAYCNNLLIDLAYEEDVYFLDYAYVLREEDNSLSDALAYDDYCHLKAPAYSRLMEYIFFHPVY